MIKVPTPVAAVFQNQADKLVPNSHATRVFKAYNFTISHLYMFVSIFFQNYFQFSHLPYTDVLMHLESGLTKQELHGSCNTGHKYVLYRVEQTKEI
jgi:hypothetical protein